jgi:nitrate/TMAO reductase-like tetraheme cytochrome c subunit
MRRKSSVLAIGVVLVMACAALATTWGSKAVTCPICGKDTEMEVIASYGSYIYRWPSKYQMVFWPQTTSRVLYFCKHCHLSAFMGDFSKIPKEKFEAVKKAIEPLKNKQDAKRYYEVPMAYRLKIAEAVYKLLDKDDEFWCRFYRIQGYHLSGAGDKPGAKAARKKALALAEKMLKGEVSVPSKKELVLIVGSMQNLIGERDKALETLARVSSTPVKRVEGMTEENVKNATAYLDEVAAELIGLIKEGKEIPQ